MSRSRLNDFDADPEFDPRELQMELERADFQRTYATMQRNFNCEYEALRNNFQAQINSFMQQQKINLATQSNKLNAVISKQKCEIINFEAKINALSNDTALQKEIIDLNSQMVTLKKDVNELESTKKQLLVKNLILTTAYEQKTRNHSDAQASPKESAVVAPRLQNVWSLPPADSSSPRAQSPLLPSVAGMYRNSLSIAMESKKVKDENSELTHALKKEQTKNADLAQQIAELKAQLANQSVTVVTSAPTLR
jgi:hypothetical protein